MKHLFVPLRIASMIKEIDFNEQCIAEYVKGGIFKIHEQNHADSGYEEDYFNTYSNQSPNFYLPNFTAAAPTYEQVLEWFRDVHKIHISINWSKREGGYCYNIIQLNEPNLIGPLTTYRNALNEGIIHAYKIVKNKP